ncbi:hypothetical protein HNP84_006367 [Thermocatellispora tengchongensis]|uniref:Uncharacterized protein n=1 Tax=Thermocatellispora tengchongensis TaxID=1073253 RepID=A0A840PD27_9ACTN|nr:hypothetical protein [Thermocatellispora tengchongensis]MBB5136616.1 hypothetical protein [Thermocatellispora tengchongensis]
MSDPTTGTRRTAGLVLPAMLTALALAGCGGVGEGAQSAQNAQSARPAAPSPSPSPSQASQSPSPTPTPSPAVTAADGSDPEACTDGNCEIAVSEPVTIRFEIPDGPAKLTLTKVGENEVGYKVTSANSRASGEASGDGSGCVVVFYSGGSSSSCGRAGKPPRERKGAVVLQVVAGAEGTAILRLVSA